MTGSTGYHAGLAAEDCVALDYARRNHRIAARRWRGKSGEIDLVAREGETVVFIEVKKSRDFATAALRLGRRQMDRICASATEFLAGEPKGQLTDVRFDLAMVNAMGAIQVIENAFMEA
ncbi:YraN family protein [Yoonia sp.]|uniref:YraN family protein n=1 Tax=Yoonia sp. TaxID=2212373 RepID=UPI002FDA4F65